MGFFSLMRCKYKGCVYSNNYKQTHPHAFFQTVTMAHWTSMNLLPGDHPPRKFIKIFYLCTCLLWTLLSLHNLRVMSMILSLISTGVFMAHVSTKIYRMATGWPRQTSSSSPGGSCRAQWRYRITDRDRSSHHFWRCFNICSWLYFIH